jgi:HSP20 family molecular chaperone IbpA
MNYYFTHFDRLFEEFAGEWSYTTQQALPQAGKESSTLKLPSHPPCDCMVSEDRNTLAFSFAMAGYDKDEVEVTANDGSISVRAKATAGVDGFTSVHNGISKKDINFTLAIDSNFEPKKAETAFSNGMLYIKVPIMKEAKAVKLM